ncbi:inner centromere protein-like [Trichosurus vulpecula]|uniref:inner centromere protein-like n=1 Tax=Trichosurus vulpecula TaxID=9337 RepID=UPI00186AF5C6|nr:inner centromere protein-like [Trichosurus vulpecula]
MTSGRSRRVYASVPEAAPPEVAAGRPFPPQEKEWHLKEEEEAPLLRKQKVQEDQEQDSCSHPEEVKMEQEEHLEKVLEACEEVEQLEVEKQQQQCPEQQPAQLEEEPDLPTTLGEPEGALRWQSEAMETMDFQLTPLCHRAPSSPGSPSLACSILGGSGSYNPFNILDSQKSEDEVGREQQEKERLLKEVEEKRKKEECQYQEQKELLEEQKEGKNIAAAAGVSNKLLSRRVYASVPEAAPPEVAAGRPFPPQEKEWHLKEEEEAPLLRKQKVQEDQEQDSCSHPEEVKMEQEEHLEKVLEACEEVEQLEVEKQQQQCPEQQPAQLEEEPDLPTTLGEPEGALRWQSEAMETMDFQLTPLCHRAPSSPGSPSLACSILGGSGSYNPFNILDSQKSEDEVGREQQEKERLLKEVEEKRKKEECQYQEQKELLEEQKEGKNIAAAAGVSNKLLSRRVYASVPEAAPPEVAAGRPFPPQEKEWHLKEEEEAPLLRKQKVQEDQEQDNCSHPEEVKMEQEEHLEKVLEACEEVEQLEVEKQQQQCPEQQPAQLEEEPDLPTTLGEPEGALRWQSEAMEMMDFQLWPLIVAESPLCLLREQQEKERLLKEVEEKRKKEECQYQEQKELLEEQKEGKNIAAAAGDPVGGPKINPNNYGTNLNSEDSTDVETQAQKSTPAWAQVTQLSQNLISQYYQALGVDQPSRPFFIPRLTDIFNKTAGASMPWLLRQVLQIQQVSGVDERRAAGGGAQERQARAWPPRPPHRLTTPERSRETEAGPRVLS